MDNAMGQRGSRKVVVAMSGGVDSSVAACLLHEQGYQVVGLFMRTGIQSENAPVTTARHRGCCSASDAADARTVAGKLGIHFYALNFQEDFESLIGYFVSEYKRGRTPNPCVACNNGLKFGKIVRLADAVDAPYVATGHYARVRRVHSGTQLCKGIDSHKDQSYVLFGLPRAVLDRVLFPLGGMTKQQVREEARRFGLPLHDKPDSVELCFVPDRNYARLIRSRDATAFQPGVVQDREGRVIGQHDGVANFTIGQRRGLGIALGKPVYVTALDARHNTVEVGGREDLFCRSLLADQMNWLIDVPSAPLRVEAKIRYQHVPAPAVVEPLTEGQSCVHFDHPQSAITPGQAVVLYRDDVCLGGGWIRQASR